MPGHKPPALSYGPAPQQSPFPLPLSACGLHLNWCPPSSCGTPRRHGEGWHRVAAPSSQLISPHLWHRHGQEALHSPGTAFWGVIGLDTLRAKVVAASHARCGSRGAGGEHPGDAQRRKQEVGSGERGAGGCGGAQPDRRHSTVARREPCPGEQTEAGWSQENALCAGELPHIRGAQQQSSLTGKQP